jgi:ABC-2 type transport system permease protein
MAAEGGKIRRRGAGEQRRPELSQGPTFADRLLAPLPQDSRAILVKDLRLFARDLRNLQALIFPVALAGIWTYQVFSGAGLQERGGEAPPWAAQLQELAGVGIAFFICLSISGALTGTGISREGKSFWLLKLAPVSPMRLLLGKLALAFLPFPLIGTLFLGVLGVVRGIAPLLLLQQWALLLLCGLGCAAFGMGLGALFPRLDWENPSQQTTWQTGCLGALFYPLFLLLVFGLVAGAGILGELAGGSAAGLGISLAGWALAIGLTAAVVWLSLLLGSRGLERIEV